VSQSTKPVRTTVAWIPAALEEVRVRRNIARSPLEVREMLRLRPEELIHLAYGTDPGATSVVVRVSASPSLCWLKVPVRIESWTPPPDRAAAVISLKWQALRASHYLPMMEADLCVLFAGHDETRLELDGRYRPPLGLLGLMGDWLVGRRVATAAVQSFVEQLASYIESH
jgi:hypothetical protein